MKNTYILLIILLISIALTACSQTSDQSNQNSKDTVSIKNTYEFKDKIIPLTWCKEIRNC